MLKSFINITLRNMVRQKGFSFINIFGLAIGMAVVILIALFIRNEMSYDKFHEKYDRIFRLVGDNPADKDSFAGIPAPLGPAMKENFPDIVDYVRLIDTSGVIKYKEKVFYEDRILMADNSIFAVFTFPLIKGDPKTALENKDSIVITESMAKKYFPGEEPMGKILNLNDRSDLKITGVTADVPINSHFHFDFIIPFKRLGKLDSWGAWNYFTYLLMHESISPGRLKEKFENWAKQFDNKNYFSSLSFKHIYYQPITRIHFQYNRYNMEPAFDGKYIRVFGAIALVILILACINFMNLSTARASGRAKEIGIKKVVGASQLKLIKQFIGESLLLAFIAHMIAVILVQLVLPVFNNFSARNLSIDYSDPVFILGILGLILFTGVISGFYPAFVLSSFKVANVLKSRTDGGTRSLARDILVVFQFTMAIVLMIGTIIIFRQLNFLRNTNLGFNMKDVINIPLKSRDVMENASILKKEFLRIPGVENASANGYLPTNMNWHQSVWWEGQQESERASMWVISIDRDFMDTLQIKMIEGKDYIKKFTFGGDNTYAYVLNEAAVKHIGWKSALGNAFSIYGQEMRGSIVGVTEDFHFRSLHHSIDPCAMIMYDDYGKHISLRINTPEPKATINALKNKWKELVPHIEFDYYFLEDNYNKLYRAEIKSGQLIIYFTILGIFIACLGLFGLASFLARQKTKEIGIRKVFGASVSTITRSLTGKFVRLVILANLLSWPIAYFVLNNWLQNFAYRIDINIWAFLLAAALSFMISLFTVSYQSIKAAMTNPIDTLRYE
jgi:putative ABC transport system permease protein